MALGNLLSDFSDQLAALAERAGASTVQVRGGRARSASGVVFSPERVLSSADLLDRRGNGWNVRVGSEAVSAELAGADPATGIAVFRVPGLAAPALEPAAGLRVGGLGLLLGRTWSGALAVSAGAVAVVGGPLRTGRGPAIEQVLRADVRVHPLGAGGPLVDPSGAVLGVATGAAIRGLPLFIPGAIAWRVAAALGEHGRIKRGYLGIGAQPVRLPEAQRGGRVHETALLVTAIADGSPASSALLVGDVIVAFDGHDVSSHDDLLALLTGERVGKAVPLGVLRGGQLTTVEIAVGEAQ